MSDKQGVNNTAVIPPADTASGELSPRERIFLATILRALAAQFTAGRGAQAETMVAVIATAIVLDAVSRDGGSLAAPVSGRAAVKVILARLTAGIERQIVEYDAWKGEALAEAVATAPPAGTV